MRKLLQVLLGLATSLLLGLAIIACVQASRVYDESGRWFARATLVTECAPAAPSAASGCAWLAQEPAPHAPYGLIPSDKDLLLTEAETMHNTGTALLTLAGVLLAAAAIPVTVAISRATPRRAQDPEDSLV